MSGRAHQPDPHLHVQQIRQHMARPIPAQQCRRRSSAGEAVEFRSDLLVHRALVTLLDSKKDEVGFETCAESLGQFAILAPMVGRYILRSRRLGYEEFYSIPTDVLANHAVSVNLWRWAACGFDSDGRPAGYAEQGQFAETSFGVWPVYRPDDDPEGGVSRYRRCDRFDRARLRS